jgi:hypothetical protein
VLHHAFVSASDAIVFTQRRTRSMVSRMDAKLDAKLDAISDALRSQADRLSAIEHRLLSQSNLRPEAQEPLPNPSDRKDLSAIARM